MTTVTLPKQFMNIWLDGHPEGVEVVRRDYRTVTISATADALQRLANDIDRYLSSKGEVTAVNIGTIKSGQAVIRHLEKVGVRPQW